MAYTNGTVRGTTLIVGSMAAASAYQQALQDFKADGNQVRAEMADRIIDGAASLDAQAVARAVLVFLPAEQVQLLNSLIAALQDTLVSQATLEIRDARSTAPQLIPLLEASGFDGVHSQHDGTLTATRCAPADGARVPLSLKRSVEEALLPDSTPSSNTSVPLRSRTKANGASAAKKASLWALTREPVDGATTPTIDESSLLTPEDLARRESIQRPDCDVKRTRKACKNCTCGLRELLLDEDSDMPASRQKGTNGTDGSSADVQTVTSGAPKVTSSCGSCYLGDAYRCQSCPYLGLPAFNPGEKVEIPSTFGDDL